ncbi:hypothetical protein GVAV_002270 [Gurleya vavrai]
MVFSFFSKSKKQKETETFKLINKISNTVIGLQHQINVLEKQQQADLQKVKILIQSKKEETAKKVYKNTRNTAEIINRLHDQVTMLEQNKLTLIEKEGNKAVFNIVKSVNTDIKKSKIKIDDVEKELEKSFENAEDIKEINEVYNSFQIENEIEFEDFVSCLIEEENKIDNEPAQEKKVLEEQILL